MPEARFGSLPFQEQIDFFRQKVPLGTRAWTDIWEGEHARAFVVAGATKDELLNDFRGAIDKAISEGTTLAEFRKDFDQIVARHGWSYNGGRGWRTRVIYETNLRSSYQSARYQQMQEIKALRPYWEYVHSDAVVDPRPEHLAWDGMVLSADDPFWETHYPPNGWGCQCTVFALSERDLNRLGKTGPDTPPEIQLETRTVGSRGPNPRTVQTPVGIDPGWAYNPGQAAFGRNLSDEAIEAWRRSGPEKWERLTKGSWADFDRPQRLLAEPSIFGLLPVVSGRAEAQEQLTRVIGGDRKVFRPGGVVVEINAASLASHTDPARARYFPAIIETLERPQEVWLAFERHTESGKVELRSRIIRALDIGNDRSILVVANAVGGRFEAWTFLTTNDQRYLNRQRQGRLIFSR